MSTQVVHKVECRGEVHRICETTAPSRIKPLDCSWEQIKADKLVTRLQHPGQDSHARVVGYGGCGGWIQQWMNYCEQRTARLAVWSEMYHRTYKLRTIRDRALFALREVAPQTFDGPRIGSGSTEEMSVLFKRSGSSMIEVRRAVRAYPRPVPARYHYTEERRRAGFGRIIRCPGERGWALLVEDRGLSYDWRSTIWQARLGTGGIWQAFPSRAEPGGAS